jgi:hypothetical protein
LELIPSDPLASLSSVRDTLGDFQIGKGALIGKAETLYSDAVFSGPGQMQQISALGKYLRRLHTIA